MSLHHLNGGNSMARWRLLAIGVLTSALAAGLGQAQVVAATTVVTFAAVPTIETPGAVAVLIRRVKGEQKNLILLRAGKATIGDVAVSLGVLSQRQARDPEVSGGAEERTTIKPGVFSTSDRELLLRFNAILNSLRQAPTREVRGIGKVPAIDVPVQLIPKPKHGN